MTWGRRLVGVVSLGLAIAMVGAALWCWSQGGIWAQRAARPPAAEHAIQLAALALAFAAQPVLAYLAVPAFFRRGRAEAVYGLISALATIGIAIAAGVFASRGW